MSDLLETVREYMRRLPTWLGGRRVIHVSCSGTHSDVAAIQSAVDSAGGGDVVLLTGTVFLGEVKVGDG